MSASAHGWLAALADFSDQVVTPVVDREGWAANVHGLRLGLVNLVLYINGLVSQPAGAAGLAEAGWWQRLQGLFD